MWIVMTVMGNKEQTEEAIIDVLAQTIPVKLLIVNQGCPDKDRRRYEEMAEIDDRIYVWSHTPPLLSLSATWNRALQMVWEIGERDAICVNNDVHLNKQMFGGLRYCQEKTGAWFVSGVGVNYDVREMNFNWVDAVNERGGPDFSCFLLTKPGHEAYPFDEGFIPAYCEDLDMHRRYMLGGDGEKIFSVALPYWHIDGGSGTLKAMSEEARATHEKRINQSRSYYQEKWGGPVNHERYSIPFDSTSEQEHVTTPELQHGIGETV